MTYREEEAFVAKVRKQLDAQANKLDELTVARLKAARAQAVEAAARPHWNRLPAFGVATAAAAVLAVVLWLNPSSAPAPLEDLDIIASGEDLELIEDLDFYDWLDATQTTG